MADAQTNSHLVVVGSSAGGIEALSRLVSTLPEGFTAPVILAQHLDPARESRLQEILARRSHLPVRTVADHEHLEAGVVYVIPSDRHVNVTETEIDLRADTRGRPKPSVDMLMSSAAEVFGEGLVAVVLTGMGSDGAEGARAVRQAGGTVIIQDPETAEFGGMPGSLAPNTVDIVADLERIGPILGELLAGVPVREEGAREELERSLQEFLDGLKERHGVDFTSYKTPTILRRLKRRMVATHTGTIEDYASYLDDHPEELPQLVNTLLIKVTQFFRDPELFAHLRGEVLPGLIEEARRQNRQLRIWSAGCATGEEAYTLAIILSELLGSEAALADVRIFATDVDGEAVDFARSGVYPAGALSGLSEEQKEHYFTQEEGHYEVKKPVRAMIVFGEHDLARRSPFPRIDLVVSRNVLIYFTTELQKRALELFAYSLRDGGYLVLGKAETIASLPEFYAPQQDRRHKIYRREGERFLMPSTSPVPTPRARQLRFAAGGFPAEIRGAGPGLRASDGSLVNRLPVGVVVVDRRYDIQDFNAAARNLLSIRGAAVGEDLLHAVHDIPYAEVRSAIDSAFRDGVSTTGEFSVEEAASGEPRYLQLACHPQRGRGNKGLAETVAIVVNDVTDIGRERRELAERLREADAERSRLEAQNGRLIESNRRLEEANGELTTLNDEMQASYEDALIAAEESQAATEEVETLNEELQATNEELETLNEELQATIEELNTTNDDLQARTAELQDLARIREEERRSSEASRRRLEAILSGMSDAVLAVGGDERVLFSNAVFTEIFGDGEPGDPDGGQKLGRVVPLTEGGGVMPTEEMPQRRAARSESFEMRFAVAGDGDALRHFEVKGRPIDGGDVGGVLLIRESAQGPQGLSR